MSIYSSSKSNTDQAVQTSDLSGVQAEKVTNITGDGNRTNITDNSGNAGVVLGEASKVIGDISMTDHGAIASALGFASDFGSEAFTFGGDALESASQSSAAALTQTGDAINKVGELAETFKNGGSSKTMLWVSLGVGVVAVVTVIAVTSGGKK
tara:strand:+ start:109 stop:567 length:459 start_codon:yes stop_codon:yes gene_type:complete